MTEDFERDLRRKRRTTMLVIAAVLSAPFAYLAYRIWHGNKVIDDQREQARRDSLATAAELAELDKALPELTAKLQTASTQIKADVTREALDAALAADGGRCPYDIAREFGLHDDLGKQLAMMHHESPIEHVDKLPLTVDGLARARGDLAEATEHLAKHEVTHDDVARVRQDVHDFGGALILVGTTSKAITVGGKYVPGHTEGDALLYLYRARKIVCAGHIAVSTPDSVMVEYQAIGPSEQAADQAADAKLEAALYDAEVAALSKQLHAAN
jgi:cell division protein FtsB